MQCFSNFNFEDEGPLALVGPAKSTISNCDYDLRAKLCVE